ncbi:Glu/Leu/Phe/Val dehydrogenase dimerization domain-containing protein [uncultured Algimonas sp.]|uniref:Leu/Phe/Val dehydrogenase n=1 Tax=uncultured Algimonas sp. TaxID=1547920 RepID=UPI00261FF106|nr:Glu/Leu/Phe/Val dehydrogenase dimerization domain-containing protein [uncultured Algimonas sp.]
MSIFSHPDFDGHEAVHVFCDAASGLRAIIAVHNTNRGPASGGTRFWHYASDADALADVLRLSRAMSYKNAMARLDLGGGKAVILKPDEPFDRDALFAAYGRAVDTISGTYITAEDVGVSPRDMTTIKTQTDHVAGLPEGKNASGDPSPVTAEGVFRGVRVAAERRFGTRDLSGMTVAVQGLGSVGYALAGHLANAGATLNVADINPDILRKAEAELGATVVPVEAVHSVDADIFAPCALGGAINDRTLPELKAKVVAGAANNQLASEDMDNALKARGILYAPDYVINAGGIINVAAEVAGDYDPSWVNAKLDQLEETLGEVFDRAVAEDRTTAEVADEMARDRMAVTRDWR